jgi:hypothetical protein
MDAASNDHDIGELLGARRLALIGADVDALERLLHADFRYVDSLGRELGRAEYLLSRRGGEIVFSRHDLSHIQVRELVRAQTVLVTCQVHDVGMFRGKPFEARCRGIHICQFADGRWQFLFGQSTSMGA